MDEFPPSRRGQRNVRPDLMIDLSRRLELNKYHPTDNPNGIIDLGSAVNELMQDEVAVWVEQNLSVKDLTDTLQYGDTQGSPQLLEAASNFLNQHFGGCVKPANILAANGVTTLLDSLTFNLANEGDVVLLPTPSYGMFAHDVVTRNGVELVHVPCHDIPEARFKASACGRSALVERLESAIKQEERRGKSVAIVLLANPENPLARCYDATVLLHISKLCARHKIHLVVDEIYALTGADAFTSMLSLRLGTNASNVHVLWGLSKDFGLGGPRLGFLVTLNQRVYDTMRTVSMFGWVASSSANLATKLLSASRFVNSVYLPVFRLRLRDRRHAVESYLQHAGIPYVKPDAGFFIWVDLSEWLDSSSVVEDEGMHEVEFLERLMDQHVFLEPGLAFFHDRPGWFRMNIAGSSATLERGLQNLAKCLMIPATSVNLQDWQSPKSMTVKRRRRFWCFP